MAKSFARPCSRCFHLFYGSLKFFVTQGIKIFVFQANIVGQVKTNSLLNDGLDYIDVDIYFSDILEVDGIGTGTCSAATRIQVECWQVLHDFVEGLLLELVFFSQSYQLVSTEFANL
jgi:hypothetical protein